MARVAKGKHSTTVVVADDGSSPVGTDEWNAAPLDTGMEGNTESTITISSGEITVTDTVTIVAAESGTADDLDFVTYANTNANDRIWLYADAGDTITLRHNQSPGAGEGAFITASAGSITLSETVGVLFIRRGTTFYQVTEVTVGAGDALVANPLSQFAATTSAQLAGVLSDETGSGAAVFATSPTLVTPVLGTPSSGTLTSCTGLPITGITSSTSAEFATLCSDETGSGSLVFATSPTLVTPVLGTPTSGTLTNATGLPAAGVVGTAAVLGANTFTGTQDLGGQNIDNIQKTIYDITAVTSSTTITIDFSTDDLNTLALAHDTTFSSSNLAAGLQMEIHITSAAAQTLAFPAGWTFYGDTPTTTVAGKDSILYLTSLSTTDASVKAVFVEEA